MLALPKVSRAGGGVVFHHVAFWRHNFNACSLLIFWMKGTERDERVSRFLDEIDKGYAVLLFILAQRKEIKKKYREPIKTFTKASLICICFGQTFNNRCTVLTLQEFELVIDIEEHVSDIHISTHIQ